MVYRMMIEVHVDAGTPLEAEQIAVKALACNPWVLTATPETTVEI